MPRLVPLTNFSKIRGKPIRRNAGPVVGDAQRDAIRHHDGIEDNVRLGRRMNNRIGNDIADRLLGQGRIRLHERKIRRQA